MLGGRDGVVKFFQFVVSPPRNWKALKRGEGFNVAQDMSRKRCGSCRLSSAQPMVHNAF